MSEQTQETQEKKETVVTRLFGTAHKTFLAGLGAASMAQDGLKKGYENSTEFAGKLVERGEKISNERREQAEEEAEKRQEQAKDLGQNLTGRVSETYNEFSTTALHRINVPTSEDIQALSKQIAALDRKVDRVRKEQKEKAAA
jgi:poly(hydroxyalkanoate) granule-associated protein